MKTTFLPEDIERKANLILRIRNGNSEPAGARQIANQLHDSGSSLDPSEVLNGGLNPIARCPSLWIIKA